MPWIVLWYAIPVVLVGFIVWCLCGATRLMKEQRATDKMWRELAETAGASYPERLKGVR